MPRLASLLALAALALAPGTAFAQGAGDEQYNDPFGQEDPSQESPSQEREPRSTPDQDQGSGGGSDEGSAGSGAPSSAPPTDSSDEAPPAPAAPSNELPRTGFPLGLVALAGAALLAAGLALRRRG
jgi:LPXTG-motif cell wall-anchored protein